MSQPKEALAGHTPRPGLRGLITDFAQDRNTYPMGWGKAMIWIFIISDLFVFGSFLSAYAAVRLAATEPWPNTSEVFALTVGGVEVPLLLIAIMTFILITSSGTMALAVTYGHQGQRAKTALMLGITTVLGITFLGMQVFEWVSLIEAGFRPWSNPAGASQFGAAFFMLTGFHGLHVTVGLIYMGIMTLRVMRGHYDREGTYEPIETTGLYWHFVDLVWVFVFAFLYLI